MVFAVVSAVMLAIFTSAQWYADNAALPRYCDDPGGTITRIQRILTKAAPVGNAEKRPYIIAAKLIFLVPRQQGEELDAYLKRLSDHINRAC